MKLKGNLPAPNALLVFEAAARLRSFSAAGRELAIAQPAVTRHIRNLEDDLQLQLFDRRNNAVHLTEEGQQFFETVSGGLKDITNHARALRNRQDQSVTIGSTFGLANMWLAPRLPALRRNLKQTPVNLLISDLYEDYDAKGVDFSIRFGSGQWPGLVSTLLMHETVVPVAAPALAKRLNLQDPTNWPTLHCWSSTCRGSIMDGPTGKIVCSTGQMQSPKNLQNPASTAI